MLVVDVADNEADWLHIHFTTAPPSAQQRCQFTLSVLCFPLLMISFDEQFQPHNGPKMFLSVTHLHAEQKTLLQLSSVCDAVVLALLSDSI